MIEKARPPAWDLLTTPGRQLSPRSSRLRRGSSSSRLGWHLAPGICHLVETTRKKKKGEKGEQSNREYSSKVLASIRSILSMHWYQMEGLYRWTELQNARIEGEGLAYQRLASSSSFEQDRKSVV